MPALHKPFRPWLLIVIGLVSVGLIALFFSLIFRSTASMNWAGSPIFSQTATGEAGVANDSSASVTMGFAAPSVPTVMREKSIIAPTPVPTGGATADERAATGPKIIKNGSLTLRVADTDRVMEQIRTLAASKDGYVSDARVSTDSQGVKYGTITIRVAYAKYDETVAAAKAFATVVLDESSTSEDVTAQYVDLQARLKASQAEEAQYLEILKKATKIDDILQVTQYLSQVRSTIEQLQGQLRYLSDKTDYASLVITLEQETTIKAPTATWKPAETFRQAVQLLVVAFQSLIEIVIVAGIFIIGLILPILALLALVFWGIRSLWRRWTRK